MPGCRSPLLISIFPVNSKIEIGGYHEQNQSAELLPILYKRSVVEVPEEVALLLREYELLEEAHRIRTYRYKFFYSLDYEGGIERHLASLDQETPYDILEQCYDTEMLYKGLASLSEKQRNRIHAHYFLDMSRTAIAKAEDINESNVRKSIEHGLRNLEKFLQENL